MRDTWPGLVTSLRRADAERNSTTLEKGRRTQQVESPCPCHNNNMSKHEDTERGGQSNPDKSKEKDWAAVHLFDNAKTAKKPRPVSEWQQRLPHPIPDLQW